MRKKDKYLFYEANLGGGEGISIMMLLNDVRKVNDMFLLVLYKILFAILGTSAIVMKIFMMLEIAEFGVSFFFAFIKEANAECIISSFSSFTQYKKRVSLETYS